MTRTEATKAIQLLHTHGLSGKLDAITGTVTFDLTDNFDGAREYTVRSLAETEALLDC